MRNFAPASPYLSPYPSTPSHLALTGRQSLCLILILSVSNHYSSLKAPQNLTANNHNEALNEKRRGRSWGCGVGEVGTGCGTGVAPAINVAAAASASVSTSGWVSSARCLLCRLSVVAGGCLSLRAATSATCSASCCCCCCCLSTVWFLLLCFCVWFARGKVNNSSKRQQNLLNYYLPLLLYLTLHATQAGVQAGWRRRPCRRDQALSLAEGVATLWARQSFHSLRAVRK